MEKQEIEVVVGALLHDIGKVLYRTGETGNHSVLGYEFLKNLGVQSQAVLDSAHYHHGKLLAKSGLPEDSIAYITYMADNISAASDRRKSETGDFGFDPKVPMQSVFNILNGNAKKCCYRPISLKDEKVINMPEETVKEFDQGYYQSLIKDLEDAIKGVDLQSEEYISSLLSTLEAYLSYIPSSTATGELVDISLYDHVKLTAAYASCMYQYFTEQGTTNYRKLCLEDGESFYSQKAFRILSLDISGIQKFIYTIHSEGALKMLRSRSFYLELMMEHLVDEVLSRLHLSRANLIFTGGGRCTFLIPNTKRARETMEQLQKEWIQWFISQFKTSLYVAAASVGCSAHELENHEPGSYAGIFQELSARLSKQKSHRYQAEQIGQLNRHGGQEQTRECKVCKSSDHLDEEDLCPLCRKIKAFSNDIINKEFFTVVEGEEGIPLPVGKSLCAQSEKELRETQEQQDKYVRTYAKNKYYTGKRLETKIWVGDYTDHKTTDEYAREAAGINRIAVLRADVDNLGQTFINGLREEHKTLSRTATLSRQLSLFFKFHINQILRDGSASLLADAGERKVTIVYSGGDDLFVVGAWNEVIACAIDIHRMLEQFAIGSLHISAGIGVFHGKYPLSVCAREVDLLEQSAKGFVKGDKQKNAVCLFDENNTYDWDTFIRFVLGEKLKTLDAFLETQEERGMAFLYRLLELIRHREDKINLARFAYVLTRLEPKENKEEYRKFSRKMYQWACDDEGSQDSQQLITAIYIYVYLHREEDERHDTE